MSLNSAIAHNGATVATCMSERERPQAYTHTGFWYWIEQFWLNYPSAAYKERRGISLYSDNDNIASALLALTYLLPLLLLLSFYYTIDSQISPSKFVSVRDTQFITKHERQRDNESEQESPKWEYDDKRFTEKEKKKQSNSSSSNWSSALNQCIQLHLCSGCMQFYLLSKCVSIANCVIETVCSSHENASESRNFRFCCYFYEWIFL